MRRGGGRGAGGPGEAGGAGTVVGLLSWPVWVVCLGPSASFVLDRLRLLSWSVWVGRSLLVGLVVAPWREVGGME